MLVYYETHETAETAIRREKLIKRWKRQYKMNAIESIDPEWKDLYAEICQ